MLSPCIYFSDLKKDTARTHVYKEFVQFGNVQKLYINSETGQGKVYFEKEECANEAYKVLSNKLTLNLKLKPPVIEELRRKLFNTQSTSVANNSNMMYQNYSYNDDLLASQGPSLTDAFGNPYTTLQDDDGTLYVPVNELKKTGFKLFDGNNIPPSGAKLKNDRYIVEQFELYMKMKAQKFLMQNQLHLDENIIRDTIERCKNDIFANRGKSEINYSQSYRSRGRSPTREVKSNQNREARSKSRPKDQTPRSSSNRNPPRTEHHSQSAHRGFNRIVFAQTQNNPHKNQYLANNYNRNQTQKQPDRDFSINNQSKDYFEKKTMPSSLRRPKMDANNTANLRTKDQNEEKKSVVVKCNQIDSGWESGAKNTEQIRPASVLSNISSQSQEIKEKVAKNPATIQQVELEMSKVVEIVIQHVENDTTGWVILQENEALVENITLDIISEVTHLTPIQQPKVGEMCVAQFEDLWFRAVIQSTMPTLKVQFIDYGNYNTEPLNEVLTLPEKLRLIPAQAIRINLKQFSNKLEIGAKLNVKPIAKEQDATYTVEFEPFLEKSSKQIETTSLNKQTFTSNSEEKCSRGQSPTENKKQTQPNSIILHTEVGEGGILEVKNIIDKQTFVAFISTERFTDEVFLLDNIKVEGGNSSKFNPSVGDVVALPYEGLMVRGRILEIKDGKYKAALIDYGIILETTDTAPLPSSFKDIPEFTCLVKTDEATLKRLKDSDTINVKVLPDNRMELTIPLVDASEKFEVTVAIWDPLKKFIPVEKYYWRDLHSPPLNDNLIVILAAEREGFLMLRTREGTIKLKEIANYLKKYKAKSLDSKPEIGELVLCSTENELFRAAVIATKENIADIHYIDYGNESSVPFTHLKMVDEMLASFENTLIKARLKGFENFNAKQLETLTEFKTAREKFTVSLVKGNEEIELRTAEGLNLSDMLRQLSKPPNDEVSPKKKEETKAKVQNSEKIEVSDLPITELKLGKNELLCISTEDIKEGIVIFCEPGESGTEMQNIAEQIKDYIATDPQPYHAEEFEVVLGFFEGEWYRATVMKKDKENDYTLLYVDYGNCSIVEQKHIRKLPQSLAMFPPIARFCCLKGLEKPNAKLLKRLQELISEAELYEVEVVEIVDTVSYNIVIPSVMETLKLENLI